jgi:hypothetical protein
MIVPMNAYLKKHGPGFAGHSIKLNWQRSDRLVTIDFQVQKRSKEEWNADALFTNDWSKNWGLWNKDVVEAFLQLRKDPTDVKAPYLEIQVSPLNQPFALVITEPRKTFFAPAKLLFTTQSAATEKLWQGQLKVELPPELKGDHLYGGFFSCLSHEPREYYALETNPETNPDFHRPELFLKLDT